MIDLDDFCHAVFTAYETYYGDLAPFSKQDLADVYSLLDEDTDADALAEAFEEAELTVEDPEEFFSDLSIAIRELMPEPF